MTLNKAGQSAGNFATLRDLTLNSNARAVSVPAGAYGAFVAQGGSSFVLGVEDATEPSVYHLQSLTLNSGARVQIIGPVIVRLADDVTLNGGSFGEPAHPEWSELEIANGGLTLNSGAIFHGNVTAPKGEVTVGKDATVNGRVTADGLSINGNGAVDDPAQ